MTSDTNLTQAENEYHRRLELLRAQLSILQKRDKGIGYAKLAILITGIVTIIWIVASGRISLYWIAAPVVAFIVLAVLHQRIIDAIERNARATLYYKRGLARIHNEWAGAGATGDRFAVDSHPYARDLDLFGNGGMFQLLCDARTEAGEETLASWLLAPASLDEVRARQTAAGDLRQRVDLRENLASLGENLRAGLDPGALLDWAESPAIVAAMPTRIAAMVLSLLWFASLAAWIIWGVFLDPHLIGVLLAVPVGMSIINALFTRAHQRWLEEVLRIEASCKGLTLLAAVMDRFERETFSAPKLVELQSRLRAQALDPSRAIARLGRMVERLQSNRNLFVVFMDRYAFYTLRIVFAIELWHKQFGGSVRAWIEAIGEMEALSSIAAYSYEHPDDSFPEFTPEAPCFEAEDFAHPLLPPERAIRNEIALGGDLRLMIISGPNMAGKSTFLRGVGINAVLAQCGAPVRARRLRMSPLGVAASVCVLDSLQGGISRFYAEILRVKAAIDMATGPLPVLFLLDELLGGTNSQDRRVGAQAVVKTLVDRGAIGLITTHDLALAEIVDTLGPRAANFHFEDRIEDGKLRFDYRLSPGVVRTSNALQLMRSIGIDV
jgi:MutS domain V